MLLKAGCEIGNFDGLTWAPEKAKVWEKMPKKASRGIGGDI